MEPPMESRVRSTASRSRLTSRHGGQYIRAAVRFALAGLMLPLAACQAVVSASEPPQPKLALDSTAASNAGGGARPASGTASNVTYTVQRGTITDSLTI